MINLIDSLIVVEGQSDITFLESFINSNFYAVNGSAINEKDINFIKKAKENLKIIILTDPDFPGTQIRNKINEEISGCYNAYVRKEFSIKNHKVGVAESTKEEIENALSNLLKISNNIVKETITLSELYELDLLGKENSSGLRKKVTDYYSIGHSNGKTLLKKLNILQITKEDLKKVLKDANS